MPVDKFIEEMKTKMDHYLASSHNNVQWWFVIDMWTVGISLYIVDEGLRKTKRMKMKKKFHSTCSKFYCLLYIWYKQKMKKEIKKYLRESGSFFVCKFFLD